MILCTLGTQKFQMNRLVRAVDELAQNIEEEVFVQTGHSTYEPKYCKHQAFVDKEVFQSMIRQSSLLITHSGIGSIMTALDEHKPVIVVPRLEEYHEHVDDHQVQIAEAFAEKGCVLYCEDIAKLKDYVEQAKTYDFQPYVAHGGRIEDIVLDFMKIFE